MAVYQDKARERVAKGLRKFKSVAQKSRTNGAKESATRLIISSIVSDALGWDAFDIIEGLQWVVANGIDVVNMSLGTSSYSAAFDSAVQQTIASGVVVVAAAGNSGSGDDTVMYPAKFEGVIAVSATDTADTIASFSSRGPQVDLAAPGVSVYSTYKNQSYATLSGTSMAAPHVAGVAALVLTSPIAGPTWTDDLDGNGIWSPSEVELRLERTAQDLDVAGFDTNYGWGLVRADWAVAGSISAQ